MANKDKKFNIGESIARFRVLRGVSQEKMAELIHVSRNTVVRMENGEHMPRADKVVEICSALSISLGDLYGIPSIHDPIANQKSVELIHSVEMLPKEEQEQFFQMTKIFLKGLAADTKS